jgi:Asp-tRNA(Asn)/Glu-tRNA(Gln) amidotransferase A subunit family amidase
VPTQGHLPPTPPAIYGWNTVGPLARRVEDLALALSVLSDTPCADFRAIPLENRCLLLADPLFFSPPSAEAARAIQAAADSLARRNMQVIEKANLPMLAAAFTYAAIMHREWLPPFRLELGKGRLARLLPECLANLRGKGRVSPSTLALLWLVSVAGPFSRLLGYGSFEKLARLRQRILAQMGPGGLILWPIWPTPAPRHGFAWQPQYMPAYTGAVNCLGFPSVVVPLGLSAQKLPLSVQIIARPNEDEVALAAAAALENEFPMPSLP